MADKVYTIVLQVDLGCPRCYKKIKKILSKYRERYQIQEEKFDGKQNTVTLSGPFCPDKLAKKLCCKAGESIKCIKKPPESPPPPPPKPKSEPKPKHEDPPKTPVQPMGVCCRPCYGGCGGGPCQQGYGYYGYGRPSYISPCCRYFSEEEPTSCAIM
ncbi:protein PYRICULARIA ORYZAE RESISTANCE 21-like [Macadamia integrifolia]|uniref:protein PYRICULARIA ORYZAE RESISTANCE 21-like n=1 Tax=Macadamia integrifolia TaxID=60698 RepID=UPI001C4F289E|nr:protein PYRICULARIA ORYZAE RESISTANCE 21-like [Macadamia integrifolia]